MKRQDLHDFLEILNAQTPMIGDNMRRTGPNTDANKVIIKSKPTTKQHEEHIEQTKADKDRKKQKKYRTRHNNTEGNGRAHKDRE